MQPKIEDLLAKNGYSGIKKNRTINDFGHPGKVTRALLSAVLVLFVLFLLMAAYFVRPASDDLYYFWLYLENGWWDSLVGPVWNKRWVSHAIINTVFAFARDFDTLIRIIFPYYVFTFTTFFLLLYRLIFLLLNCLHKQKPPFFHTAAIALLFIFGFYLNTSAAIEVWFWFLATAAYLWPVIFAIGGISAFFEQKAHVAYPGLILFFLLLGGTLENFILTSAALLLLAIMYFFRTNHRVLLRKTIIAMFSMCILPLLTLVDKGFLRRLSHELVHQQYSEGLFSDNTIFTSLPRAALLGLVLVIIFYIGNSHIKKNSTLQIDLRYWFTMHLVLLVVVFATTYLPVFLVFGNSGPTRTFIPFDFFFSISLFTGAYLLGLNMQPNAKLTQIAANFACILIIASTLTLFLKQYSIISSHSKAYSQRIELIKSDEGQNAHHIFVPALPDSGILASQEASRKEDNVHNLTTLYFARVLGFDKLVFVYGSPENTMPAE